MMSDVRPWEKIDSAMRGDYRVFRVREDHRRSPATGKAHPFYVIETSDWVNVIPVTPEGEVVFIRQYRHGTEEVTLEVPGGMVDPGETPAEAARRELREETGYDAASIVDLGAVSPNPAIQNNRCHSFLALGAHRTQAPQTDATEIITVTRHALADVPGLITGGRITHALVVVAFYLLEQYRRAQPGMLPGLVPADDAEGS